MLNKHQHQLMFHSSKVITRNNSPINHNMVTLSPNQSYLKLKIISNHTSRQKQDRQSKYFTKREHKYDKVNKKQTATFFRQKNGPSQLKVLKNRIKNVLRRMKYKDKLLHLQKLIKQGRSLSQQYGFFYVTGAMFIFKPQSQIKLSLWIHPNIHQKKCMHPIKKHTQTQKQKQFYCSLKFALRQIFPTIPLGNGLAYTKIIDHIYQLQLNLQKRLLKSVTPNMQTAFDSPRQDQISMNNGSNKVLKISRLVDFNQGISIIEQGQDQQKQLGEQQYKFKKKNNLQGNRNHNKTHKFERRPLTKRQNWKRQTFDVGLSTLVKTGKGDVEDEKDRTQYTQLTLQQSKFLQDTKPKEKVQKFPNLLYQELRKILNA